MHVRPSSGDIRAAAERCSKPSQSGRQELYVRCNQEEQICPEEEAKEAVAEEAAEKIQDLFLAGKKDEAAAAVPTELADEISLVGSVDRIKDRLNAWRETPVTSLLVSTQNMSQLRTFAELVLG